MIACSGCLYRAAWLNFPPIASWVWILPLCMLTFSAIRRTGKYSLIRTAPLAVSVPLAAIGALGPGNLLSIIGVAQVAVVLTAISANWNSDPPTKNVVRRLTSAFLLLFIFGAVFNYYDYYSMTLEQRIEFVPEHVRASPVYFYLLPL